MKNDGAPGGAPTSGRRQGYISHPMGRNGKPKGFLLVAFQGPRKDGTRGKVRESAKTLDWGEAEKYLARRLREVANDQEEIVDFETTAMKKKTIADLLDGLVRFWKEKGTKSADREDYRIALLKARFGSVKARNLTYESVSRFMQARLAAGKAPQTVNLEMGTLKRAYSVAKRKKEIVRVPGFPEALPVHNTRTGFFEQSDIDALLPHLPTPLDEMTRFAFRCGWRRGELIGMTWEMVTTSKDGKGRTEMTVTLPTTKNGCPRSLPVDSPEFVEQFARLRKAREYRLPGGGTGLATFVFHRRGQQVGTVWFGKRFRAACGRAGLGSRDERGYYSGKLFHDLRRSAVRNLVRGGVAPSIAMEISGHKTGSMFKRYDIADPKDKRLAMELARKWAQAQEPEPDNVTEMRGR